MTLFGYKCAKHCKNKGEQIKNRDCLLKNIRKNKGRFLNLKAAYAILTKNRCLFGVYAGGRPDGLQPDPSIDGDAGSRPCGATVLQGRRKI
ncbi:hypothetical protein BACCAP_00198 [Pseudoflavonifractor capillosus ATCC 29799]|uniref:Uncharacterized protein n=1 Tax=Pseudoflavonifractor capillosus ATCC 29799 TaxID=411467 RepID=A6NPT2_9FIRM|nr:hypothetical protein BACCAP_00198 [Pseudoflavonifractor capillosus ATCC 29799]